MACGRRPQAVRESSMLRSMSEPVVSNAPEWTVSELSGAAEADAGGRLRPCPRARRAGGKVNHALVRPRLSRPEGRARLYRRGDLEGHGARVCASSPRWGMEVIATGKITTFPGNPSTSSSSRRWSRPASARCWRSSRSGSAARRRGPVRRRRASSSCPSCPGDRRRHLADRRRDPRHPAPASTTAFPATCWSGR